MGGRVCEAIEQNSDVIYVSPVHLSEKIKDYYYNLLSLRGVQYPKARLNFVIPENLDRFPSVMSLSSVCSHSFVVQDTCLTVKQSAIQVLRYSPRAMRMIRSVVSGRPAYIVPRYFGKEDRELAIDLRIPILSPQRPELVQVLNSSSECRQLFDESNILTAPGVHDIYDKVRTETLSVSDLVLRTLKHR